VSSWDDFSSALSNAVNGLTDGSGLRILTEVTTSPTFEHNIKRLQETYPGAVWHQYSPAQSDSVRAGADLAFGQDVVPHYNFANADVVVSLDADFLGEGPAKLPYTRAYSARRRIHDASNADDKSRVYVFESTPTLVGATSDHRVPVRAARMEGLVRTIANRIGLELPAGITPDEVSEDVLSALVDDLLAHEGSSLVVAGDSQPASVHALVHALNYVLGNIGQTVHFHPPATTETDQLGSLKTLVDDINAGSVQTLLILGGNPVYSAPANLDMASAIASVPFSAHLSTYVDETSSRTSWHLPQTHDLEVWGDAKAFDGTVSIGQPLISPFVEGKASLEVLAMALGESSKTTYDLVQDYWKARVDGSFDSFWREALYQGIVPGSTSAPVSVSLQASALAAPSSPAPQGLELVFRTDPTLYDGRFNNNGWLQETPKPFTKLTWDNAALISPKLAERFDLKSRDVVQLRLGDMRVDAPVWVQPGQAEETVTVHLGYGRERTGHVGEDTGFNAYALRTSDNMWFAENLELRKTRKRHELVSTQMHQYIERDRHIVRHGTTTALKQQPEHPHFVHPVEHHHSDLYDDYIYEGYAWGMVIDMNVCTGCNACITACQAENNIPIVGKDQVGRGRAMHWLRVDTYYSNDLDNPEMYQMPVACMHCEKAPCEPVCPVGATIHDHEGLNVMVYNRCVGTRYCSNACPYKVRRFNWLQYAELDTTATSLAMQKNPNVTVRSRGVMEKCTYCTQRIAAARIQSNNENRRIVDGEVVTACQAACPAEAIVFGDLSDADSRVVATKTSPLNYGVLTELNTVPRTTYLARVANPHPSLESLISHDDPHMDGANSISNEEGLTEEGVGGH
jgi:molybdopterin-containing oxidoreductase family iron-sulfur binding subunit